MFIHMGDDRGEKSYEPVSWPSLDPGAQTLVSVTPSGNLLAEKLEATMMIESRFWDTHLTLLPKSLDVIAFSINNFHYSVRQDPYPDSDTAAEPRSEDV